MTDDTANNPRAATHDRYHRQRLLPAIGDVGQERLLRSTALVVGVGALGTVIADALCRAGVGTLRLVDRDVVERTNLQRQSLYVERDVGYPKAEAARDRLAQTNSDVTIEAHAAHFGRANALPLMEGVDAVLDGTDNFETRLLINDACVKTGTPYVYAGAVGTTGSGGVILPGETGCLLCLLGGAPGPGAVETCDTAGVLGPLVWTVACWQATEAIKLLTGHRDALTRGVRTFDAWSATTSGATLERALGRDPGCPCCAGRRFDYLEGDALSESVRLCGRGAVQVTPAGARERDMSAVEARLSALGRVERAGSSVRAEIDEYELTVFPDGRAIVRGAEDEDHARSIYDRYVGG